MKIITISNQKGGVGKTTTAINLSTALALLNHRILLIDVDPQANATSGLGHEPDGMASCYQPLLGKGKLLDKVQQTRFANLSLIPSGMDLSGVEIELARSNNHLTRLSNILHPLKNSEKWDYCLIDTPPSLGVLMTSALAAADEILIPLQCEWFGLEGLAKISEVIELTQQSGVNPNLHLEGILMTMHDSRTNLSKQVVDEVTNFFPKQIYQSVIPRSIRIGEAPSHGKTIFEHAPTSAGSIAYEEAAREFLNRHGH